MSETKRLVMLLQEQAENLGFSTVQEALDNGYEMVGANEPTGARLKYNPVKALEVADKALRAEREECVRLAKEALESVKPFVLEAYRLRLDGIKSLLDELLEAAK